MQRRLLEISTKTSAKNGQNFLRSMELRISNILFDLKTRNKANIFRFSIIRVSALLKILKCVITVCLSNFIFFCHSANLKRINFRGRFSLNPVLSLQILPSAVVNLPGSCIVTSLLILHPSGATTFYRNIPV